VSECVGFNVLLDT